MEGHQQPWLHMGDYRDSYVGKQQRPPCLPIGLLVAALEAKKAATKDSLAAQAQSRGDGDNDSMDNETLRVYRICKSRRYVWESYRSSLKIENIRASISVGLV